MTPQQLKNSILQRAIEGRLVEQRPEEGTAQDLLKEIQAEKARLVKEGKIKKSKALPPITEEEKPFELPEGWEWARLGELCLFINGDRGKNYPNKSEYVSDGIAWINTGHITDDGFLTTSVMNFITKEKYNSLRGGKIVPGDLVFCLRGATFGKVARVEPYNVGAVASSLVIIRMIVIELREYIYQLLRSPYAMMQLRIYDNGTAQPNLAAKDVAKYIIPVPPLTEQHRIVAKIEELLPLIDKYDKAYTKLTDFNTRFPEAMKKSLLQYAIQGKLVEQRADEGTAQDLIKDIQADKKRLIAEKKIKKTKALPPVTEEEKPFDIPEGWEWVRWGDLSQSIQYGYNAPAQTKGRIKMVRISDIQDNRVLWDTVPYCQIDEENIETYALQPNDILFARTGGTVGKSYLVTEVPEEAIYAGYLIRTRYSNLLVPQYLKFFMESSIYWEQLRNGTIATAQPNCNGKTLGNMILPLPPLAEQRRIVAKLEELLPFCDQLVK